MADLENVGKNVAEKASNTASQASNAASNAASKTSENLNNVATQAANNTSANNSQVADNVSNGKVNASKPDSVNHETNNNLTDAEERKAEKQRGKQLYNTEGASARYNEDMTPEEKKAFEKERAAHNTAEAINASADVAASSGNAYAKAFGYIHKGLNDVTGGQYGEAVGKVTSGVNRLMPGGKTAQKAVNSAVESGAAKAVGDALAAKNGDGAKKAGEEVAKDAAEEKAKDVAEDASKKIAEQAAKKSTSSSSSDSSYESTRILKSPIAWVLFGLMFMIVFISLFFPVFFSSKKNSKCNEFPYVEMDYYDTITVQEPSNYETYDVSLEEYVAGVVQHEAGGFYDKSYAGDDETFEAEFNMLKAQAVAARSYAQYMMKLQGFVINSGANQIYTPNITKIAEQAANETAGIIIIKYVNNEPTFYMTQYDALAYNESCGGEINEKENYIITCQKNIKIPIDWLKSRMLESDFNYFSNNIHGNGMSQWGAYYLMKEQGYDYKQVLELFYDDGQIISLHPNSCSGICNTTLEIIESPESATQLTTTVEDFFKSHGTSVQDVNDGLKQAVMDAGPGSRCGVVTAALYTVNTLLDYDARLPYYWGGGSGGYGDCAATSTYGFCPEWGTYNPKSGGENNAYTYNYTGIDCGRYVMWIFLNGGVDIYYDNPYGTGSGQFIDKPNTENYDPGSSDYTGQPGDVIVCNNGNHAELILQGDGNGYYIAHASGVSSGIKVNYVSYDYLSQDSCEIVDMTWYYENQAVSDYESAFESGRAD